MTGWGSRHIRVLIPLVLLAAAVAGCSTISAPRESSASPGEGDLKQFKELAPTFTLPQLDGEPVALAGLRGRWVLVNFWATWCAPCREEMPYLDRLSAEHAARLTVLAINMREPVGNVRTFVEEYGLSLPILLEPDDATLLAYGVRGLPLSLLVAPDGTLAKRFVGPIKPGEIEEILFQGQNAQRLLAARFLVRGPCSGPIDSTRLKWPTRLALLAGSPIRRG